MDKKIDTATAELAQVRCEVCATPFDELGRCPDPGTHATFAKVHRLREEREAAEAKAKADDPIPYTVEPVAEPIPKWSSATTTPTTPKAKPYAFPTRSAPPPPPGLSAVVPKRGSVAAKIGDWAEKGNGGYVPMPRDLYFALPSGACRDVAFYLCSRLTNDGSTRPTSVRLICTETRLGRRTVQRALGELAAVGFESYQDDGCDGLAAKRYIVPSAGALFGTHAGAFHVPRPPRARRGRRRG